MQFYSVNKVSGDIPESGAQGLVFSKGALEVYLRTETSERVAFVVSNNAGESVSFGCTPDGGKRIPLRIREILGAMAYEPREPYTGWTEFNHITLQASSGEGTASLEYDVIKGALGDWIHAEHNQILSVRPQISRTWPEARELVAVLLDTGSGNGNNILSIRAYLHGIPPVDKEILDTEYGGLYVVDVSPARIRQYIGAQYDELPLDAYDLRVTKSGWSALSRTLRFVVFRKDVRAESFCFLNSHGVFDTITANGSLSSSIESEVKTFVNNRVEEELSNDYTDKYETDTGYLGTRDMVRYWTEFLHSSRRFVLSDDKLAPWKRIVVDEITASENERGTVAGFRFVWHFADPPKSAPPVLHGNLDDYDYAPINV